MVDAAWIIVALLAANLLCLIAGIVVPGGVYRDMRTERDVYREAAQHCAQTVTIVQAQNAAMMATMQSVKGDHHVEE